MLMETGGIGHTRHFARARLKSDQVAEAGRLYPVRITGVDGDVLEAEIADGVFQTLVQAQEQSRRSG